MLRRIVKLFYNRYLRNKQRLELFKELRRPTYIHLSATFHFPRGIEIGKYCRIGSGCHIDGEGGVSIGDGTILAPEVVVLSSSHAYNQQQWLPYSTEDELRPVRIGQGCWLGWGAMVVPGVHIGDGAVVAMGAVVTKDVQAGEIVGGNPAKVLNNREAAFVKEAVEANRFYLKEVLENRVSRKGRRSDEDMKWNLLK